MIKIILYDGKEYETNKIDEYPGAIEFIDATGKVYFIQNQYIKYIVYTHYTKNK